MAAPVSRSRFQPPADLDVPPGELRHRQWIKHPSQVESPYTYTPAQICTYLKEIKFSLPSVSSDSTLQPNLSAKKQANGNTCVGGKENGPIHGDKLRLLGPDFAKVISQIKPTWDNLVKIMRGHLLTFPFENTLMHYSASHELDVTPEGIYQRLVVEKKGGLWCLGVNGMLFGMLRGLGYRVYSGASRVNEVPGFLQPYNFSPLGHFIIFVQPFADYDERGNEVSPDGGSRATYLIDVGFGSPAFVQPILLEDTEEGVTGVSREERHRLKRSVGMTVPSTSTKKDGKDRPPLSSWNLQVWHSDQFNGEWRTIYTFTEQECFFRDYLHFNIGLCYSQSTIFWHHVLAVLFVPHAESESGMNRIVLLGNQLKAYGETKVLHSERERIEVLKKVFGIDVGDVEQAVMNISGRAAALGQ